jgi:hypothetical protein
MDFKTLSAEQHQMLLQPLPAEAITPHPTKNFLSSIKNVYVTERFNEVFGVGAWQIASEVVENTDKMVVVKTIFTVPTYNIRYECYGGNDNPDRGDAYKGAVSDAITKIGSWLGVGADVFKGQQKPAKSATAKTTTTSRREITSIDLDNEMKRTQLLEWSYADFQKMRKADPQCEYDAAARLAKVATFTDQIKTRYNTYWTLYLSKIYHNE